MRPSLTLQSDKLVRFPQETFLLSPLFPANPHCTSADTFLSSGNILCPYHWQYLSQRSLDFYSNTALPSHPAQSFLQLRHNSSPYLYPHWKSRNPALTQSLPPYHPESSDCLSLIPLPSHIKSESLFPAHRSHLLSLSSYHPFVTFVMNCYVEKKLHS